MLGFAAIPMSAFLSPLSCISNNDMAIFSNTFPLASEAHYPAEEGSG